jgi:hypothetical protein
MYGFTIGGVTRGDLYTTKSFILTLIKVLIPLVTILYVWLRINYKNYSRKIDYIIILSIFVFVLFDMLFKGDRRISLAMLFAIGGIIYFHKSLPKIYYISGIIGVFLLILLGAVRNRPVNTWADNIQYFFASNFSPSGTEFGPFSMIANHIIKDDLFFSMPSFFTAFLSTIPGFLFPERPIGSSIWFVKTYFPVYYSQGGGWAFNIIMDGILSFGFFAPIFLSLFYLSLFLLGKQNGKIGILFSGILTFSARFGFTGILQAFIYSLILMFILFVVPLFITKIYRIK